ncbi:MAG: antitoxin family protein [Desulfurococcales archaeon]|nr:antitoxin family protein [Desulfurococcales archaeon]
MRVRYKNEVLRPLEPLDLREGEKLPCKRAPQALTPTL